MKLPMANCQLPIIAAFWVSAVALAQESPTPAPPASMGQSPSPTSANVRNVRISFVPPPMEGTISLGIFNSNKKLVRVLHREAKIDDFKVDESSLTTSWDGKNDAGEDLPAGKYHARGYAVELHLKIQSGGVATQLPPPDASDHVSVKLVTNPLLSDVRSVVDVRAGFDANGSFLETTDGLPLRTISSTPHIVHIVIAKKGDMFADVWQDNALKVEQFQLASINAMMAFDCGEIELK